MQVILQQDVPNLGKKGEVKDVAPGYARNHLLPRGLALEATPQRLREWERRRDKEEKLNRQQEEQARARAEQLTAMELVFTMPAGEGGRLFGSVTPADIAAQLSEKGFTVDKKSIELDSPIRSTGRHSAGIKLHPGIKAQVALRVEQEQ